MRSQKSDLNENIFDSIQTMAPPPLAEKPYPHGRGDGTALGDAADKPYKRRSLWQGIKQIYFEYCANTSIHGVQYLGEQRPWKEKLFWVCVFVVSIYCCSNLIENIYVKWNETPVIVSFAEKSTPVWSIPFPAITICSETKRPMRRQGKWVYEIYLYSYMFVMSSAKNSSSVP